MRCSIYTALPTVIRVCSRHFYNNKTICVCVHTHQCNCWGRIARYTHWERYMRTLSHSGPDPNGHTHTVGQSKGYEGADAFSAICWESKRERERERERENEWEIWRPAVYIWQTLLNVLKRMKSRSSGSNRNRCQRSDRWWWLFPGRHRDFQNTHICSRSIYPAPVDCVYKLRVFLCVYMSLSLPTCEWVQQSSWSVELSLIHYMYKSMWTPLQISGFGYFRHTRCWQLYQI